MIKNNRKIKNSDNHGYLKNHHCNDGCRCETITEAEMQGILRHIFIMRRLPVDLYPGDRELLLGAALVCRNGQGKGADGWTLTEKGEDLFLDLYPD